MVWWKLGAGGGTGTVQRQLGCCAVNHLSCGRSPAGSFCSIPFFVDFAGLVAVKVDVSVTQCLRHRNAPPALH